MLCQTILSITPAPDINNQELKRFGRIQRFLSSLTDVVLDQSDG